MRCLHEASLYPLNCFITLTYDDKHLPHRSQLHYPHVQKFFKRLLKHRQGEFFRRFAVGEYGGDNGRPHYHAIVFNHDFGDKKPFRLLDDNPELFTSKKLEDLWGMGLCTTGNVTFESAAYVARYCVKKVTGKGAEDHYRRYDEQGEYQLEPEFMHCSLKPGIGAPWLKKWHTDVYPHDYVTINGKEVKPPKYYDRIYQQNEPDDYEWLKYQRGLEAAERADDNTYERLEVKAEVTKARLNQKQRNSI